VYARAQCLRHQHTCVCVRGSMSEPSHVLGTIYALGQPKSQGKLPDQQGGPYPCCWLSAFPSDLAGLGLIGQHEFRLRHNVVVTATTCLIVVFNLRRDSRRRSLLSQISTHVRIIRGRMRAILVRIICAPKGPHTRGKRHRA
jgi:hypothetical protein